MQSHYLKDNISLEKGRLNDLEIHGPPTPADEGLGGFNRGWSYVVK